MNAIALTPEQHTEALKEYAEKHGLEKREEAPAVNISFDSGMNLLAVVVRYPVK